MALICHLYFPQIFPPEHHSRSHLWNHTCNQNCNLKFTKVFLPSLSLPLSFRRSILQFEWNPLTILWALWQTVCSWFARFTISLIAVAFTGSKGSFRARCWFVAPLWTVISNGTNGTAWIRLAVSSLAVVPDHYCHSETLKPVCMQVLWYWL